MQSSWSAWSSSPTACKYPQAGLPSQQTTSSIYYQHMSYTPTAIIAYYLAEPMSLSYKQAQYRRALIQPGSVTYWLHLDLQEHGFRGLAELQFTTVRGSEDLWVDCTATHVHQLVVDGNKIDASREENKLYLRQLSQGPHRVLVEYAGHYSVDERGLLSFIDFDGRQYVYSTFEPFYAHRVFPVFDQQNIKAPMSLSVTCPKKWTRILSNQIPLTDELLDLHKYTQYSVTKHSEILRQFLGDNCDRRMALFPPTKPIPTYTYCVLAGPFQQIELAKEKRHNGIPMSWYCSASYLPYVQKMAPFLFEVTIKSMQFFEEQFGTPYQFAKYDQIFVPEMQACAMENNGMVTYHDAEYIWTDSKTLEKALDLFDTVTHELTHHWFGNLVSLHWWDELWLKESFAEFCGYWVLDELRGKFEGVQFENAWCQLLYKKSERAYMKDTCISTMHPVRGQAQTTAESETLFNGITYVKGASILRQLLFLIGRQNFSAALKQYFSQYSYKNAGTDDFFKCLQPHFVCEHSIKVDQWRQQWLQSCSVNHLQATWERQNTETGQHILAIRQKCHNQLMSSTLRTHKIKIALFKQSSDFEVLQVLVPAAEKIHVPLDQKYKAVLLNYQDYTYAKIQLDSQSQTFFFENLSQIKCPFARTSIWRHFYDMVVDSAIPSTRFVDLFVRHIVAEESDTLLERNFQCVSNCINLYTPEKYRQELVTRIFYLTLQMVQKKSSASENALVTLKHWLCVFGGCDVALSILDKWVWGKQSPINQVRPSLSNQWVILENIFSSQRYTRQQKIAKLQNLCQQDQSQAVKLNKSKLMTMFCSEQQYREKTAQLVSAGNPLSVYQRKYLIQALNSPLHSDKSTGSKQLYFDTLSKHTEKEVSAQQLGHFAENMAPGDDNLAETIQMYQQVQIRHRHADNVRKWVQQQITNLGRRVKAYALFEQCL